MHMGSLVRDESVESDEVDRLEADQAELSSPKQTATEPSTSPTTYRLPKRRGLDSIRIDTATARSMASKAKLVPRAPDLSDELGNAIRTLANVFCDLPAITGAHKKLVDVEAVLCKVQELQELKGQFITLGTDSTMVMDIEAAIRRLEALVKRYNQRSRQNSKQTSAVATQIKAPATQIQERSAAKPVYQGESDSGYESMEPPRQNEQHKSTRRSDDQDVSDSGEEDSPLKRSTTSASDFTRWPSFRAGDDRLGLESLKETLGEIEAGIGTAR
jgi:prefoldin subunit 5